MGSEESFGLMIKQLREQRGWSVRHTAKRAGISHWRLAELESGISRSTEKATRPSPETVCRLADAFEVSRDVLLEQAGYARQASGLDEDAKLLLGLFEALDSERRAMVIRVVKAIKGP